MKSIMLDTKPCLTWDFVFLPMVKFAYDSSGNRSTGLSLFEAVTDCKPKKLIDLLILIGERPSASAESFVQHVHDLDTEVPPEKKKPTQKNTPSTRGCVLSNK